jgi:hypothetical protein
MEPVEIEPGLLRWTAPHPEWRPGATPESPDDWPQEVGCVFVESPEAIVVIDGQLPSDPDDLWAALDARVDARPVHALTTIQWHRRSRDALVERYGASTSRARAALPAGVEPFRARGAGETMFWLPAHRTLVPGDRLLGAPGGGVRLCPESWLRYLPSPPSLAELADALRPLLGLGVERVLVSHGEPVLARGHQALAEALA